MNRWITNNYDILKNKTLGSHNPLYVPGSHDSFAYSVNLDHSTTLYKKLKMIFYVLGIVFPRLITNYTKTQKYNISEQLNMGVRYLDLRISFYDNKYFVSHTYLCNSLDDTLTDIKLFILQNPHEFLIIRYAPDSEHYNTVNLTHLHNYIIDYLTIYKENDVKIIMIHPLTRTNNIQLEYIRHSNIGTLFPLTETRDRIMLLQNIDTFWPNTDNVTDFKEAVDGFVAIPRDDRKMIIDAVITPSSMSILSHLTRSIKYYAIKISKYLYTKPEDLTNVYAVDYIDPEFCSYIISKNMT